MVSVFEKTGSVAFMTLPIKSVNQLIHNYLIMLKPFLPKLQRTTGYRLEPV